MRSVVEARKNRNQ